MDDHIHVWLGSFPSEERLDQFLGEMDQGGEDDDGTEFSVSQGQTWYDDDCLSSLYLRKVKNIKSLLAEFPYIIPISETDILKTGDASNSLLNSIVVIKSEEIAKPKSVKAVDFSLTYFGEFPKKRNKNV